jgi:hypothetical protein
VTNQNTKPLIHRTTAMTDAFVAAAASLGVDTSKVKLPLKREAAWTVTRRDNDKRRSRGRK